MAQLAPACAKQHAPTTAERAEVAHGEMKGRDAVQFGRKISTTVQILSVGEKGSAVEFRSPEGQVRTVTIDDGDSREKIAALRPGDKVAVTYVEKLALKLDESHVGERGEQGQSESR